MSDWSEQKKELNKQKEIRKQEDDLVKRIQSALDTCTYGKSGKNKLEESQFRNLVSVAAATDSPEVVKNFIRYQVGREEKWGRGETSLATKIIKDIDDTIKTIAEKIAKKVEIDDFKPIWMELIRRYLGYGARHLVYKNKGES